MAGASRFQSSFEAVWTARCLAGLVDDENLVPAFASANIKILPYQIAAARFALRSANIKYVMKAVLVKLMRLCWLYRNVGMKAKNGF